MKKFFSILILIFVLNSLQAQSLKKLGLVFDSKTYNFGDVEQWNNQPAIFTFTNKSKMALTILPLFTENDLDVIIPEKPIQPGETIIIKAMYYTDGKGPFTRSFPIYFGFRADPVNLKITGNIKSLSPEAYIQCPMAKPELSKPRIELVGDVAEIDSEFPISGSTIEIIGLQNKKEVTLFSNSRGRFGAKLPTGNYMVKVSHPNYITYTGTIYIGQTSPPLRVRLTPISEEPIFAENTQPKEPVYEKRNENKENLNKKDNFITNENPDKELSEKVDKIDTEDLVPDQKDRLKEETESIVIKNNKPKNNNKLERDIDYVKNDPKDNPYSSNDDTEQEEIPNTLTTYKESDEYIPNKKNEEVEQTDYDEPRKEKKNKEEDILTKDPKKEQDEDKIEEPRIKKEKPVKEKVVPEQIPTNNYAFRVLDKNSLDAIENASVFVADLYDKKNKHNEKTDIRGIAEIETINSDYRFLATADGYISNEIRIVKDDQSEIFKIFLTPVSSLYDEIYEAKKARQKENEEALLSKLSFGKTEFSFAKDEPETIPQNIQDDKKETFAYNEPKKEVQKQEPIIVEKIIHDKEKEDSLQNVIAMLETENAKKEAVKQALLEKEKDEIKKREQEKVDSLNNYIEELLAKNNAIKNDLEQVEKDKEALASQSERDKEKLDELKRKESEMLKNENQDSFSTKKYQANNIMFLIDISTSMGKANKMEMLKESIKNLTGILREIDRVAIITYNQKTNIVLESISGNNKKEILSAIDSLKTGGLTNGVKGITTAYEMLEYYFIPNGNNQIILATDGLFSEINNELTETELNRLVKKQADKNMKLTVVGFGKDKEGEGLMNKLAKNGNGQYIQISNDYMTRDVLIREIKLNSEIKN